MEKDAASSKVVSIIVGQEERDTHLIKEGGAEEWTVFVGAFLPSMGAGGAEASSCTHRITVSGKENNSSQSSSRDPRDRATSPSSTNPTFPTKPNPRGFESAPKRCITQLEYPVKYEANLQARIIPCWESASPFHRKLSKTVRREVDTGDSKQDRIFLFPQASQKAKRDSSGC